MKNTRRILLIKPSKTTIKTQHAYASAPPRNGNRIIHTDIRIPDPRGLEPLPRAGHECDDTGFYRGVTMAVLADSRGDNVVSISAVQSLKMLALSVVWGSWMVVKSAVARLVSPLWPVGDGYDAAATGAAVSAAAGGGAGKAGEKRLPPCRSRRSRPPPCLSTTVYGTHSYVKVKV